MKSAKLLAAFLFFFSFCGSGQSLTGLWNGTFANDSTTLRSDQPFEIALTEYKGKVYGYSRREFVKNDTLYFVLKRVKGKIEGDSCEVTEDEYLSHNFPTVDKGVKITYTFRLNKNDTTWSLDGRWKTNKVVKRKGGFYALTGNVGMTTEKDLSKSKIFPHLAELKLDEDVPFYAVYKKQVEIENEQKNIAFRKAQAEAKKASAPATENKQAPVKDVAKNESTGKQPEPSSIKKEIPARPANDIVKTSSQNKSETNRVDPEKAAQKNDSLKVSTEPVKRSDEKKPTTEIAVQQKEVNKPSAEKEIVKEKPTVITEPVKQPDIAVSGPKEPTPVVTKPVAAANVEKRRLETIQTIEFQSDSITLALYDNGEIDGDTVSVLINGEVVLAQQGLKATALRKTIYITPAMQDSFTLVLYAENLGKYAPNTGLIIVRDGEESSQVRFSADLQKNVSVLFRRKKK